ncbi:hypothetical protein Tsubulata_024669 [Turnera subulata]|uniref:DUF7963 domain-containing protein n=1 Tax=Turnera subulata TaxID=218843 RepID=A0A9Q0JJG5_9ROSI|nr:hypothetical protein Tsubulata_024669 [Turnera subulata]
MASTSSTPTDPSSSTPDDTAARAVTKRYEGLVTVRNKAIKGKGAWYWAHLEPILLKNPDTDLPRAVKLRCSLCDAAFSASNPSRTASEHLKRGACPHFAAGRPVNNNSNHHNGGCSNDDSAPISPMPISSLPSPSCNNSAHHHHHHHHHHRKRNNSHVAATPLSSLALVESTRNCDQLGCANAGSTHQSQQHLVLSGGKDDLGALAMLEDSVKKLKSPKTSPGPSLSKDQVDSALGLLTDWVYESCGSVSFSSIDHPKFRAFLNQVGLPCLSRRELYGARLENRFHEVKSEAEARIRDAMFFQVASDGWKRKNYCGSSGEDGLVKFSVNLPNGTTVYHKTVVTGGGSVSSKYAEEVMLDAMMEACGGSGLRCVGIVADKFKDKALRNLEVQYQGMVNLSCQVQGFLSLIKDFFKELQLLRTVTENCSKLANFVNNTSQVRSSFQKYRTQELDCDGLLRVPCSKCNCSRDFMAVHVMLEDVLSNARVLQMVALDDSYKAVYGEDSIAREVSGLIQNDGFWNDLEAAYSLVKLIKGMAQDIEAERPLIGQCLPLWEDLKAKVKDWCVRFNIGEGHILKIVEKRFKKNYHPAWSAAFVLDPLYLMKDPSGKYLPPFKCLTHEQEKDVDKLITRLVSREDAHVAFVELMKWRSEGLDPLYAQAVQIKQRDPFTGKMKVANPQGSRLVWETCLSEYKTLAKVAVRLIFLHATTCGFKCNWSFMKWVCAHRHSRSSIERAQKIIGIAAHSKLERRDFSSEEEKDGELFRLAGCEVDMLNEVFPDEPSV